jgi:YidC/Oxa1 family membrane protein insertase
MSNIFTLLIYQPIYNLLILVYNLLPPHDFGVAIIFVTVFIKLLLVPVSKKQIESQKKMQELQPKLKEIQEKFKQDKEKQTRATMEFYKTHKTNPFSGCLPTIFQLVFLIAIYRVLFNISKSGLMINGDGLYSFISNPGQINHMFLGIIDLSKTLNVNSLSIIDIPHITLIVMAAAAQYMQTKMLMPQGSNKEEKEKEADFSQIMSKQMLYFGPILTLFIGIKFPAGLALYWLISTLFMLIQQKYLMGDNLINLNKAGAFRRDNETRRKD